MSKNKIKLLDVFIRLHTTRVTIGQLYGALVILYHIGRASKQHYAAFCTDYDFSIALRRGGDFLLALDKKRFPEEHAAGNFPRKEGLFDIIKRVAKPMFDCVPNHGTVPFYPGKIFMVFKIFI